MLRHGDGLFLEEAAHVAAGFPAVQAGDLPVDACAHGLLLHPESFDVTATTSMFGDILSDQTAGMTGGLGLAPGLPRSQAWRRPCVEALGDAFAVAQAVHGSAPDLAAERLGNPVAEILSLALLLRWLPRHGQPGNDERAATSVAAAQRIEGAIARVLRDPEPGRAAGLRDAIRTAPRTSAAGRIRPRSRRRSAGRWRRRP